MKSKPTGSGHVLRGMGMGMVEGVGVGVPEGIHTMDELRTFQTWKCGKDQDSAIVG